MPAGVDSKRSHHEAEFRHIVWRVSVLHSTNEDFVASLLRQLADQSHWMNPNYLPYYAVNTCY